MIRTTFSAFLLAAVAFDAASAAERPNILIILIDDFGYGDLSIHGCKDIPTPHIDALGKSSLRCTQGYISAPQCSPTRAGLMTGRYQQRFGHAATRKAQSESKGQVKRRVGLVSRRGAKAQRKRDRLLPFFSLRASAPLREISSAPVPLMP